MFYKAIRVVFAVRSACANGKVSIIELKWDKFRKHHCGLAEHILHIAVETTDCGKREEWFPRPFFHMPL